MACNIVTGTIYLKTQIGYTVMKYVSLSIVLGKPQGMSGVHGKRTIA